MLDEFSEYLNAPQEDPQPSESLPTDEERLDTGNFEFNIEDDESRK